MNGNNVGLRIISALVLVAAIAAIGYFAFQAGVAQGSPVTIQAPSGQTAPAPYPYYGWGMPFHRPFGFGYGFGCFGSAARVLPLLSWRSASSSGVRAGDIMTACMAGMVPGDAGKMVSRPCSRNGTNVRTVKPTA